MGIFFKIKNAKLATSIVAQNTWNLIEESQVSCITQFPKGVFGRVDFWEDGEKKRRVNEEGNFFGWRLIGRGRGRGRGERDGRTRVFSP